MQASWSRRGACIPHASRVHIIRNMQFACSKLHARKLTQIGTRAKAVLLSVRREHLDARLPLEHARVEEY
jgi:hypothetical protein